MGDSAFTRAQFDAIYPPGIRDHSWNHARNRIIARFLRKHGLDRDTMLEIGCGKGVVVEYLRSEGMPCFGVEVGDAVPFTGGGEFIFTRTDAFDLAPEMRQRIHTVLLLDVIEHLADPEPFIAEIREKFPHAGHLVITVPARRELWTNYDVYNGHFRRYDLYGLRRLAGHLLQVRQAGYFFHLLYPVFWILARVAKKRETDIKAPSGWLVTVHRMISAVLQADYRFIPAACPGTSIIALFSFRE